MTKIVKVGNIAIGDGNVTVQSMAYCRPSDTSRAIAQMNEAEGAGCDIFRFAVTDEADARSFSGLKKYTKMPLVADIHFDYRLAVLAAENGADKIRINPGNIGGENNILAVAAALKANGVPVRVGANSGSIEKEFYSKYGASAIALGESALKNVALLEKYGISDIVVSAKASSAPLTVAAYEYIAAKCDYPLHLGVTEAGDYESSLIKSAVGIGALLVKGIGDTVRVSVTGGIREEIEAARRILRAAGVDKNYADVVSCPTCGRCNYDLISFAAEVRKRVKDVKKPLKIAVMGCAVNGVGEGKEADIGIAGGKDNFVLFKNGKTYKTIKRDERALEIFLGEVNKLV